MTNKKECVVTWEESNATIVVYESEFCMAGVDQLLRYIKYATKKKIMGNCYYWLKVLKRSDKYKEYKR